MCGIFGFLNFLTPSSRRAIIQILLQGLHNLQYRGHDSVGISFDSPTDEEKKIVVAKTTGGSKELSLLLRKFIEDESPMVDIQIAIGHTRWATHGKPAMINAHPQYSSPAMEFVVVHNGSIDNYNSFRQFLDNEHFLNGKHSRKSSSLLRHIVEPKGQGIINIQAQNDIEGHHKMVSETDTEVIAKFALFAYQKMEKPSFPEVVANVCRFIHGSGSIMFKSAKYKDECCVFRVVSPLVIGFKYSKEFKREHRVVNMRSFRQIDLQEFDMVNNQFERIDISKIDPIEIPDEIYVSSDAQSFAEHTRDVMYLENWDIVHFSKNGIYIFNIGEHEKLDRIIQNVEAQEPEIPRIDENQNTLSEIYQQPAVLSRMVQKFVKPEGVVIPPLTPYIEKIRNSHMIILIASGSSYNAVLSVRTLMEKLLPMPIFVEFPSEMNERGGKLNDNVVCFFVSQSGETADTLFALRKAKEKNALCVAITNTRGSSITHDADLSLFTDVGIERGVASTKTFSANVLLLTLIAFSLSSGSLDVTPLLNLEIALNDALKLGPQMEQIASNLINQTAIISCGRGTNYAIAREASMKIKTLSYIHSESFHEGELKHGPIALVEKDSTILFFATTSIETKIEEYRATLGQIAARGGLPIVVTDESSRSTLEFFAEQMIIVPKVEDCLQILVNIIPVQLLAISLAKKKEIDPDRPRNIAKCATII